MKFILSTIIAASLSASSLVAAKTHAKDQRKLDEMHAAAFGAVVVEHSASDWKKFLSEGPLPPLVQVDPMAGHAEQKKPVRANKKNTGRELGVFMPPIPPMPPAPPKVGYYAIDTEEYGGSMEVKNKKNEECIYIDEGIGKDEWRFGITKGMELTAWNFGIIRKHTTHQISTHLLLFCLISHNYAGPVPNMTAPFDTYLQLFEKDAPVMPVYKAFQGAKQLCIGEKAGNIAYLYIVFNDGCYWLIGSPDAGRDDHLPKLKIRDQDRRRGRRLGGSSGGDNDADKLNDKYNKGRGDDVIVRFRDGPGIVNTLLEIYNDGSYNQSPNALWYFVPNEDKPDLCAGVPCPFTQTCNPKTGMCEDIDICDGVPCPLNQKCVMGQCVDLCLGVPCVGTEVCDPADGQCKPDDGLTGCQIPSPPNAGKCVGTKMGRDESITQLGVDDYLCDGSYAFGIAENSKFVKLIKYSCNQNSWVTKWQNGVSGLELKVNSVGKLAQLNTIGGTNSVWEVNCGSLSSSKADDVVLRINASKDSIIKLEGQGEFPDGDWGLDSSGNVNSGTCSYVLLSTTNTAGSF